MKQICVYLRSSAVKKFQKIKQPIFINLEKSQQVVDQLMQIPRGTAKLGWTRDVLLNQIKAKAYDLSLLEKSHKQLTQRTPNELTPPEFVLVRTSSLFYLCSFMNRRFMADFAQECPYIKIGQQPADQLPWLGVAEYQLVRSLPEPLDTSLPSVEEIEAELSGSRDE